MGTFYTFTVMVTQVHTLVKIHLTVHLECMNFTVCKLYFNKVDVFIIYLFILAAPRGLQDLGSPTRDQTHTLSSESAES